MLIADTVASRILFLSNNENMNPIKLAIPSHDMEHRIAARAINRLYDFVGRVILPSNSNPVRIRIPEIAKTSWFTVKPKKPNKGSEIMTIRVRNFTSAEKSRVEIRNLKLRYSDKSPNTEATAKILPLKVKT